MINNNLLHVKGCANKMYHNKNTQLMSNYMSNHHGKNMNLHSYVQKILFSTLKQTKYLHINNKSNSHNFRFHNYKISNKPKYYFSSQQSEHLDYNSFKTIRQLNLIQNSTNKFQANPQSPVFLSNHYSTISLDLQKKLQKIQSILHSPQKNLYKIVQQIIIVLQSFSQLNRRQILEQNVLKVIKEFNSKLINAYLQTIQIQQLEQTQKLSKRKLNSQQIQESKQQIQQTDSNYLLHQNYTAPPPELEQKQFDLFSSNQNKIDVNFILYYVESIKNWMLAKLQTDAIIRQAEEEMYNIFNVRQVSALNDTLKTAVHNLVHNYIQQPSIKKRQLFPFDIKLRGICLLPFFQNKKLVQKYLQRLSQQNLIIYLKQSQIINVMYDITQIKPDLTNLTNFVYQIQSTKVYVSLGTLNAAYIKSQFINYTRKYMVSYQQIQFYEVFRQLQPKIKYPTIRTFIRLIRILKCQAHDLHCQYNKIMNRYNYNIIISIIITQSYTIQNTKFSQIVQLFRELNNLQPSGQIFYEELSKYLRSYWAKNNQKLNNQEQQKLYQIFLYCLQQAKPILKYQDKQGITYLISKGLTDNLVEKQPYYQTLYWTFCCKNIHILSYQVFLQQLRKQILKKLFNSG